MFGGQPVKGVPTHPLRLVAFAFQDAWLAAQPRPKPARARELLTRTDLSLSEVAFAVGFADQSHFARRFRQMLGVSPGQFRKL
jgi:methylphosphotriester-DNA--protein-cysteine methyltransferase